MAYAVDYYKANNTTSLTAAGSWWLDAAGTMAATAAPTNNTNPADICIWNNLVTGPQTITVANVGIHIIRILNPGGPISLDGTSSPQTITVGNGGIDMSQATQDLALTNVFYRLAASTTVTNFNVAAGRTLTFGTAAQVSIRNNSTGTHGININTDGTSSGTVTFAANIAASNLVIGAGRVEFNSPTGNARLSPNTTVINGGTVLVHNTSGSATGSGAVTVNANATLGGTGIITGAVTANANSVLSPGDTGTGTLTVGSLTLASGSNIIWEATNTTDADKVVVSTSNGLVINGGTLRLYNPGTTTAFTGTGVYTLFAYSGAIGGSIDSLTIDEATKIPGRNYTISLGAGVVTLRITSGTVTPKDWAVDASGNWSAGANWTGGSAPDAVGAIARITGLGAAFTAPRTVTLDSAKTVGQLILNSTQATTLAGADALTLNDDGAAATLNASGANHTISAPLALSTGGVLSDVDAGHTLTLGGVISGVDQGIVKTGEGTLLLTAANSYTGTTSVASGVLQIGNGGATGSVGGAYSVTGTLRFNRSGSVVLGSAIAGTGTVDFAGNGDTTLQVANSFSGTTTVSAGTLIIAQGQALQNSRLTLSSTGGNLVVADPVAALTLGSLAGDRALPLTNTAGASLALTVGGNNASTAYSGSPTGTGLTFAKSGTGTLTLTGTHVYSGDTTVNAGVLSLDTGSTFTTAAANLGTGTTARILVNGGTLNATSGLVKNSTVGLAVAGGVANFSGAITTDLNVASGTNFINVTGGVLNAGSISTSRGSLNQGTEPASGQTTQGLYINGGAVNVTGTLGIGAVTGANSSVSARMDSGSLTVGGAVTVGINNTARWSVLDINGGTFTSTDAVGGILLGSPFAGNVVMHIRNSSAVVKAQRVQFGQGALAGSSILSLANGSLYVGAGGLTLGSSEPTFTSRIRLNGGKLGATADWSSTIPLTLDGTATLTGADEADVPHTITLHGAASGIGGLVKNGAGTVLMTSPASDFYGPVVVQSGTLGLGGKVTDLVAVTENGGLAPQGVLTGGSGGTINGRLVIGYNSGASVPVSRIETPFDFTLGSSSTLSISGTGVLPGPAYVLVKAGFGINGTFASVTGVPAGFTLTYNYDDDSDAGTPGVIALVGSGVASPYDTWAASYSLTGDASLKTADPDNDGLSNFLEYAFDTSPVASEPAGAYTLGRSGNFLTLSFDHPADSTLVYKVEASNTLTGSWAPVHTFPAFTTAGTAAYIDDANLNVTPRRFLRLTVTPPAP